MMVKLLKENQKSPVTVEKVCVGVGVKLLKKDISLTLHGMVSVSVLVCIYTYTLYIIHNIYYTQYTI